MYVPVDESSGSPPQVRGKRAWELPIFAEDRITPAGAGKTFALLNVTDCAWDHPRRCGENRTPRLLKTLCWGSPPQVRGKLFYKSKLSAASRITPAGAGKTGFYRQPIWKAADHPRRCGENQHRDKYRVLRTGSPPQVRGKPFEKLMNGGNNRITPAGAGKTLFLSVLRFST